MKSGNGHTNGHEDGDHYRALMDDEELAKQFAALVQVARAKGFTDDEISYGLLSATTEYLLDQGEPECCIMQLLVDFMATYYEYWHGRMDDEEGENGKEAEE